MVISRFSALLGLVIFGIVSRLLPHPPNFNSINAIALFSACYLGSMSLSLVVVLSIVFFSDLFLGFHSTMPSVYLSFGLIILMGHMMKRGISFWRISVACAASSLLFFLISNFGVWMTGCLYPKTLYGLGLCYIASIPFLANQVIGDLTYGLILFGSVQLLEIRLYRKSFVQ